MPKGCIDWLEDVMNETARLVREESRMLCPFHPMEVLNCCQKGKDEAVNRAVSDTIAKFTCTEHCNDKGDKPSGYVNCPHCLNEVASNARKNGYRLIIAELEEIIKSEFVKLKARKGIQ